MSGQSTANPYINAELTGTNVVRTTDWDSLKTASDTHPERLLDNGLLVDVNYQRVGYDAYLVYDRPAFGFPLLGGR